MKNKYLILSRNTKANAPNYTEFYEKNDESAKDKWRETIRNQNVDVAILFRVDDLNKTLTILGTAEKN